MLLYEIQMDIKSLHRLFKCQVVVVKKQDQEKTISTINF